MPKLVIKPTSVQMSVSADGTVSLQFGSGVGEYEVQISPSEWGKLGATAKWFDSKWSDADLLASAVAERDAALEELRTVRKSKK